MGQLNLIPQADKAGGHRHIGEKVANHPSRAGELPPATQRIVRTTEGRKDSLRHVDQPAGRRATRFNVTASDAPATSGFPLPSGIRLLVIGLILVALVPNLTLGAVLWLGLIDTPWSTPAAPPPVAIQAASLPAVLTVPSVLDATTGEDVAFPIALDGTDGVPARSIIAISGLPLGSRLSDGRPYGESEWNLKPDQIGDLRLALPAAASGESKLTIKLITPDDKVIAETETILRVASAPSDQAAETGASAELAPTAVLDSDQSDADSVGAEARPTPIQAAVAPISDPVESPSNKSAQSETDEGHASWVQPSAYVNMREGPSSSASVVGVIAKGAKLSVIDRKRGWLQVTNPATSEKGWIYSGYIAGAARPRHRAKQAAAAEPEAKSGSFWDWLNP